MTVTADPEFPETVYDVGVDVARSLELRQVKALERIATALEQGALAAIDARPQVPAPLAQLPPVQSAAPFDGCPIHHQPWKVVPAGVSKKTGKAYDSFRACSVAGCDQRPPR